MFVKCFDAAHNKLAKATFSSVRMSQPFFDDTTQIKRLGKCLDGKLPSVLCRDMALLPLPAVCII